MFLHMNQLNSKLIFTHTPYKEEEEKNEIG